MMSNLVKRRGLWARFKKDTKGNFALIWALGLTATMISVGAGLDMATSTRVSTTAQAAADQVALSAAVFYSKYERLPENSDEGYMGGQIYRGDDVGFNFPSSVYGGNERVRIQANYDEENREVVVRVSGRVQTAFMGMFSSKYKTLPFSSESSANFKDTALKNPASIALVLDNSGSMLWDDTPADCENVWSSYYWRWVPECEAPNGAESRIDGLKDSVEFFMDKLDSYVGSQAVTGKRVLRTGMIPYNNSILDPLEVDMKWGTITNGEINRMQAGGGTNSAPPIARAWDWLFDENAVHEAETGEDNPLRYMIFMTDGQNSGNRQWFEKDGTNYWRGIDCSGGGYWCYYRYRSSTTLPSISGHYGWEEGEYVSAADHNSKNSCQAMKDQGVRVFTIGFALEPGTYKTNYPPTLGQEYATISESTTQAAYAMLSDCASAAQDFVAAENVESLEAAFSVIGESIIEDVVRLSQ